MRYACTLAALLVTQTLADAQHDEHVIPVDHAPGVHRWAIPSNSPRNIGYYVGGGAVSRKHGELPYPEEGTWGWDYRGWLIPRRVNLLWWHGRRDQGGTGAYRTDGPHLPHLPHGHTHGEGHEQPEGH